jgi:hypothetical protein
MCERRWLGEAATVAKIKTLADSLNKAITDAGIARRSPDVH